jgi:hypothetical protein
MNTLITNCLASVEVKGWFPYDRYDRYKKSPAIGGIVVLYFSQFYLDDRSDHMETGSRKDCSTFSVAIVWKPALSAQSGYICRL